MLSHSRNRAPGVTASSASAGRRHLDLDRRRPGTARRTAAYAAASPPGRELVVVLDHRARRTGPCACWSRRRSGRRTSPAPACRGSSCGCRAPSRPCPRARRPTAGCGWRPRTSGDSRLSTVRSAIERRAGRAAQRRRGRRRAPTRVAVRRRAGRPRRHRVPSRAATASSDERRRRAARRRRRRRGPRGARPTPGRAGIVASVVTSRAVGPRSSSRARSTSEPRVAGGKSGARSCAVRLRAGARGSSDGDALGDDERRRPAARVAVRWVSQRASSRVGEVLAHVAAAGLLAQVRRPSVSAWPRCSRFVVSQRPRARARPRSAAARAQGGRAPRGRRRVDAAGAHRSRPRGHRALQLETARGVERPRRHRQPRRAARRGSSPAASRAVDVVGDPVGEDEPLEQGVRREPVRAVDPGARALAARVQARRPRCAPAGRSRTPPERVVLGGRHRQQLGRRVEAELAAARDDRREALPRGSPRRGAGRRARRGRPRSPPSVDDRAGDDVARRELGQLGCTPGHEPHARRRRRGTRPRRARPRR